MGLLKLLSSNEIVAQLVNFLILFFLLRALGWKKILAFLDERRNKVSAEFDLIAQQKQELVGLRSELEKQMKNIEASAADRIAKAVKEAKDIAEDIKKDARSEAQRIVEQANSGVRFEANKIKGELKDKIVDMVVAASERVLAEKMTFEMDRKIVENFIVELEGKK